MLYNNKAKHLGTLNEEFRKIIVSKLIRRNS